MTQKFCIVQADYFPAPLRHRVRILAATRQCTMTDVYITASEAGLAKAKSGHALPDIEVSAPVRLWVRHFPLDLRAAIMRHAKQTHMKFYDLFPRLVRLGLDSPVRKNEERPLR